jgi:hypothetical protein
MNKRNEEKATKQNVGIPCGLCNHVGAGNPLLSANHRRKIFHREFYRNQMKLFFILIAGWISVGLMQPAAKKTANLQIQFRHVINNEIIKLDNVTYVNDLGQTYTVSKFKYYIGQIRLRKTDGKEFLVDEYFLIDEEDEASKTVSLENIPAGEYEAISFILGVDSLRNCSGAQSGALDPFKGMFWSWNTGYIFLKLGER